MCSITHSVCKKRILDRIGSSSVTIDLVFSKTCQFCRKNEVRQCETLTEFFQDLRKLLSDDFCVLNICFKQNTDYFRNRN